MKQLISTLKRRTLIEALILAGILMAIIIAAAYIADNAFWNHLGDY